MDQNNPLEKWIEIMYKTFDHMHNTLLYYHYFWCSFCCQHKTFVSHMCFGVCHLTKGFEKQIVKTIPEKKDL